MLIADRKRAMLCVAFLLLLSFSMHLIELHHDHPHAIFGEGMQVVFHGEDRKWNLIPAFFVVTKTLFIDLTMLYVLAVAVLLATVFSLGEARRRDSMQRAFYSGLLNPKSF